MRTSDMDSAWREAVRAVTDLGSVVAPRGKPTRELSPYYLAVDARRPVLTLSGRALGYRFMAAEAYWILSGDDRVETIAPYSRCIADFSDDGWTFFGAYGPRVAEQMDHVVRTLHRDPCSRQAVITTWRPNPPETRDVPCTVALCFMVRGGRLDVHVTMRSSDLWLGTPYDVFNFSMLAHLVCGELRSLGDRVEPGTVHLTTASLHLYEPEWERARGAVVDAAWNARNQPPTPDALSTSPLVLLETLRRLREPDGAGLRWWGTSP